MSKEIKQMITEIICRDCGKDLSYSTEDRTLTVYPCMNCFPDSALEENRNDDAIKHDKLFASLHELIPSQDTNGRWKVFVPMSYITWDHPTKESAMHQARHNLEEIVSESID